MTRTININTNHVMKRARLVVAYVADRHATLSARDKEVLMRTSDQELVMRYFNEALCWAVAQMQRYAAGYSEAKVETGKIGNAEIEMIYSRHSKAAETYPAIADTIEYAIENKIVSEWLRMTGEDESQVYMEKATASMAQVLELCNRRTRVR